VTIQQCADGGALASALAARILDAIRRTPRLVLGLPTGRTPLALYRALREQSARDHADWSRVRTFNLDEFVGRGGADPGSYRAFMHAELFDHVSLDPAHVDMPDGRAPDLAAECRRYEQAIIAAGGLDLLVLGIGLNGHIGFNEPADGLHARTHVAELQEATRAANAPLFGGDPGRVPHRAVSMGMATILAARAIVLIATGAEKSAAVAGMIDGPITPRLPASFLQLHPCVAVMLDAAAAGGRARQPGPADALTT
jgi:glucosamine-6-phosphate deaminase